MRAGLILRLLLTVSWPHWRTHPSRTLLTTLGVGLGVATVVGISNVSSSVLASVHHMVETVAGPAELEITNPSGMAEEILQEIAVTPGVRASGGLVEGFLPLVDSPEEQVLVLGVDLLDSPLWKEQFPEEALQLDDAVLFVSRPNSVALPKAFLRRHGLTVGDSIRVLAPTGPVTLAIGGVLDDRGPALLFGGALAVMDLPRAQRLLGRVGRLDRVGVSVTPEASVESVAGELSRRLAGRGTVAPPESRGKNAERLLFSLRSTLTIMSLGAVIVGTFIVFQTVAVSIHQRRSTLAILSAVGVRRRSVVTLCLAEILLLATVGATMGLLLGEAIAWVATGIVGTVVSEVWLRIDAGRQARSAAGMAASVTIAMTAAAFSAVLAARTTLAAPTAEGLRPGIESSEDRMRVVPRLGGAVLLLAGVWLVAVLPRDLGFLEVVAAVIGTQALGFFGLALVAPLVVRSASAIAKRVTAHTRSCSTRLAVESLGRTFVRNGTTVSTVGAAFSIAVIVAVLAGSTEASWVAWITDHFAADLFVGRGDRVRLASGAPMGPEIAARLSATPGVASIERFRVIPSSVNGHPVFLQGYPTAGRLARGELSLLEGDVHSAARALIAGTGALVTENLAFRLDLRTGDTIALPSPQGTRSFRVEGVFVDYLASLDHGSVAIDVGQLEAVWHDDLTNLFRVWLEPGAPSDRVRASVLRATRNEGLYVLTARDFLAGVQQVIHDFWVAVWGLEIVAAVIGMIGVVNAQMAAIMDRRREIAVLSAIGIPPRTLRRTQMLECGQIGLIGGIVGAALGLFLGAQIVLASLRLVTGWNMPLSYPWGVLAGGIAVTAALSALAGVVPARRMTQLRYMPTGGD